MHMTQSGVCHASNTGTTPTMPATFALATRTAPPVLLVLLRHGFDLRAPPRLEPTCIVNEDVVWPQRAIDIRSCLSQKRHDSRGGYHSIRVHVDCIIIIDIIGVQTWASRHQWHRIKKFQCLTIKRPSTIAQDGGEDLRKGIWVGLEPDGRHPRVRMGS